MARSTHPPTLHESLALLVIESAEGDIWGSHLMNLPQNHHFVGHLVVHSEVQHIHEGPEVFKCYNTYAHSQYQVWHNDKYCAAAIFDAGGERETSFQQIVALSS